MWRVITIPDVGGSDVMEQVETIFFDSAATQSFATDAERAAYRDLWLGRYLRHCPHQFLIAVSGDGEVAGYLAGAFVSNRDPLPGPDYYAVFPAELTTIYPAHIHVNVRAEQRGQDVGSGLVAHFRARCSNSGINGLHAVTATGSQAAAFFSRCGLTERERSDWRGRNIVLLAEAFIAEPGQVQSIDR